MILIVQGPEFQGPRLLQLKFGIISYTISSTSRKRDETIRVSLQRRVQKSIRVKNFRIREMFLVRMNQVSDIENFKGVFNGRVR